MKRFLFPFITFVLFFAFYSVVPAQSTTETVYIPGSQSLEISNIINADTAVSAYRVYVLDRGAIYYIENAFEINSSCKFATKGDPSLRPPVLAAAIRADGSNEEWYFKFIQTGISVELDSLYLLSMRSDGKTLGWSRAIHIGADDVALKLRGVIFDGWTEAGIRVDGASWVKLDVQDCHFRNMQHSSSYFGGQAFLSGGNDDADTTIFINNTFFSCNSYIFSIRGYDKYSVFEHNTIVYTVVNPFLINRAQNLHMMNNLFYAAHGWGGDPEQVIQGWMDSFPDTTSSSIINPWIKGTYLGDVSLTGPERNNDTAKGIIFDPSKRIFEVTDNVYYKPDKLVNYYTAWNDTVSVFDSVEVWHGPKQNLKRVLTMVPWINPTGYQTLDSLTNPASSQYSPSVNVEDGINEDPGFTDAGVVDQVDSLIGYVNRIATRNLTTAWQYHLNFPPAWPLPENLAYSNATLLHGGSDGFAMGDLNWFPDQKAEWENPTDVNDANAAPFKFKLSQNYPNPFNPATKISFTLSKAGYATLNIYNVLGQKVATLVSGNLNAGTHEVNFNAANLSTGVYIYRLESENNVAIKKMILLK